MSDDTDMAFSCFNSLVKPPAALAGVDCNADDCAGLDSSSPKLSKKRRQRHAAVKTEDSQSCPTSPILGSQDGAGAGAKKSRTSVRTKKRSGFSSPLPAESAHQRCVELADALIRALKDDLPAKADVAAVQEKPKRVAGAVALANLRYWREACYEASGKRVLSAKEHPELHAKAIELMKARKAADQTALEKAFASVDPVSFSNIALTQSEPVAVKIES